MIVTLTPNPSIDRTVTLDRRLSRGHVHRVESVTSQSGGKGVNISRAAAQAGVATLAVLPAAADDPFVRELEDAGIACVAVPPAGELRVNLTITEPDGTTTKLNSPGPQATPALLGAMTDALLERTRPGGWAVLAGSLPPGAPPEWYGVLVTALRGQGVRVAVDTSDAPLAALVAGFPGTAPDLMKPNGHELASLTGVDPAELEAEPLAAARAAGRLLGQGVGAVLATLGAHGAVLVTAEGAWHAPVPEVQVLSTVGAGDSSLFGYLLGAERDLPPSRRLALAVAYGSAAAGLPGTGIPTERQVRPDAVLVRALHDTARSA